MFTSEQITKITSALGGVANSILSMFVDLLPIIATVAGLGFGIRFVYKLFNKTSHAK